jgi:FkbM family methyltransferase
MISRILRAGLKRIVPRPLWIAARRTNSYARRLLIWSAVMSEIEGATEADRKIIRRSARHGIARGLKALDVWQNPELISDAIVRVPAIGEFAIRASTDDLYHVLPSREAAILAELRKQLRPGSIFIDAGANIGFFTVLAAQLVGPIGQVVAIEMMPDTASRLREHLAMNQLNNVIVHECALSNQSGDEVVATVPEGEFGRATIARANDGQYKVTVVTRTLDELLADTAVSIDLIKMDLEGAEALALEGASKVLQRTKVVIFEQLEGDRSAEELLEKAGFHLVKLDASNMLAQRAAGSF